MNNSKIWLVVNPTVGVPLFLTAVAVGSFNVHMQVVNNTEWVASFLKGEEMAAVETKQDVQTASVEALEGQRVQVTLPDGTVAWAVIEAEETTLASALTHRTD